MIDPTTGSSNRLVELFAAADADDAAALDVESAAQVTALTAVSTTEIDGASPRPQLAVRPTQSDTESGEPGIVAAPLTSSTRPVTISSPRVRDASSFSSSAQQMLQSDTDPTYSYCQVRYPLSDCVRASIVSVSVYCSTNPTS